MFKKGYIALWLLLAVSLIVVIIVAFSDDISIGSYTVKKAPLADILLENNEETGINAVLTDSALNVADQHAIDSLPQRLFIFGDSMTHNLSLRLAQYAKQNGHEINAVNWDSSNTKIWADCDTLEFFIKKFKPTQIFIALGSNELVLPKPELRRPQIKRILSIIDTIPYIWIGPPNWKDDTGINEIIASECKPGSFFLSNGMSFERGKDKIHPTRKSAFLWMDSIVRWLPNSTHPFRADIPSDTMDIVSSNVIFLKALNK